MCRKNIGLFGSACEVHELNLDEDNTVKMYDPFWEIYSLISNSWRKIDGVNMPNPWASYSKVNLHNLNEVCHWLEVGGEECMVS